MNQLTEHDREVHTAPRRDEPTHRLTEPPSVHVADTADAPAVRISIAALLAGSVIQDGEIVQMIVKPSRLFIVLNSLFFSGLVLIVVAGLHLSRLHPLDTRSAVQLAILFVAARMMFSALQWMGRYYIVTNHRLIRLSGIFDVQTQTIPLRKVSSVRFYRTVGERLLGKGSLEILSQDYPVMLWQTISKPNDICDQVHAAVKKAQGNGHCG